MMMMITINRIFVFMAALVPFIRPSEGSYLARKERYQHFDDYLIDNSGKVVIIEVNDDYSKNLDNQQQHNSNGRENPSTMESAGPRVTSTVAPTTTENDEYSDESLNCCLLGKAAGERGYHCHVGFYATRIMKRNENRAHNKKLYFNGPNRNDFYGQETMEKFEQCISSMGNMFHRCCKIASRSHLKGPRYDTAAKRLHAG